MMNELGKKKVAPPHLAPPYVEIDGEDVCAACVVGTAMKHEVANLVIKKP